MEGNQMKMREALKEARRVLRKIYKPELSPLDGDNRLISSTVGTINAALSAPPRNCDVGTAEEQEKRYYAFCDTHRNCSGCPHIGIDECALAWTQMPYEALERVERREKGGAR